MITKAMGAPPGQPGRSESIEVIIKREVERLAKETGLAPAEIVAEAVRLLKAKEEEGTW